MTRALNRSLRCPRVVGRNLRRLARGDGVPPSLIEYLAAYQVDREHCERYWRALASVVTTWCSLCFPMKIGVFSGSLRFVLEVPVISCVLHFLDVTTKMIGCLAVLTEPSRYSV